MRTEDIPMLSPATDGCSDVSEKDERNNSITAAPQFENIETPQINDHDSETSSHQKNNGKHILSMTSTTMSSTNASASLLQTVITDRHEHLETVATDSSLNGSINGGVPRSSSPPFVKKSLPSTVHHQQQQQVLTHNYVSMAPLTAPSQGYLITVPTHHGMNNGDYVGTSLPLAEIRSSGTSRQMSMPTSSGRRSIHLRLVEDNQSSEHKGNETTTKKEGRRFFPRTIRLPRVIGMESVEEDRDSQTPKHANSEIRSPSDHGSIVVSWYEGTTTAELQAHVRHSVCRKLGKKVDDIRLLDEGSMPHEEVVLTPYIPDGTRLMVMFSARPPTPIKTILRFASSAPHSPSRAPTPYTSDGDMSSMGGRHKGETPPLPQLDNNAKPTSPSKQRRKKRASGGGSDSNYDSSSSSSVDNEDDHNELNVKLDNLQRSIGSLDNEDKDGFNGKKERLGKRNSGGRRKSRQHTPRRSSSITSNSSQSRKLVYRNATKSEEKKHVVFVLANYFVLFLSLISIFAELHDRGPRWMERLDEKANRVHACSVDSDSLYKCIQEGDVSGLLASFALWIAKNNKLTTRFFLFGFGSAQKLWTVVYEAMVTAICWGTSYLFIRRALNPDTRVNFLEKYWKDAIYGSLAGFNAAFLKAVLKNLIPKEVIEDVLDNRPRIKIVDIFKAFAANK